MSFAPETRAELARWCEKGAAVRVCRDTLCVHRFRFSWISGDLYLSPLPIYLDYRGWTSKLAIVKKVFHCNKVECEMVCVCRSIPHITVLIAMWLSRSIATSRSSDLYLDKPIKKDSASMALLRRARCLGWRDECDMNGQSMVMSHD